MSRLNINTKKGFTIIEVVLVLAIAGLIFLMVFVALPSLQSSQHDTQRRSDVGIVSSSLTQYITNNGSLPEVTNSDATGSTYESLTGDNPPASLTGFQKFIKNYVANVKDDPNGEPYKYKLVQYPASGSIAGATYLTDENTILVVAGAKCKGEEDSLDSAPGKRSFAVMVKLERSGFYCTNS